MTLHIPVTDNCLNKSIWKFTNFHVMSINAAANACNNNNNKKNISVVTHEHVYGTKHLTLKACTYIIVNINDYYRYYTVHIK